MFILNTVYIYAISVPWTVYSHFKHYSELVLCILSKSLSAQSQLQCKRQIIWVRKLSLEKWSVTVGTLSLDKWNITVSTPRRTLSRVPICPWVKKGQDQWIIPRSVSTEFVLSFFCNAVHKCSQPSCCLDKVDSSLLFTRAHSLPWAAEFRANPPTLPFIAEFLCFWEILQNLIRRAQQ